MALASAQEPAVTPSAAAAASGAGGHVAAAGGGGTGQGLVGKEGVDPASEAGAAAEGGLGAGPNSSPAATGAAQGQAIAAAAGVLAEGGLGEGLEEEGEDAAPGPLVSAQTAALKSMGLQVEAMTGLVSKVEQLVARAEATARTLQVRRADAGCIVELCYSLGGWGGERWSAFFFDLIDRLGHGSGKTLKVQRGWAGMVRRRRL